MQKNKEAYQPDGITGSIFEEDCLIPSKLRITKPDHMEIPYKGMVDAMKEVVEKNPYWKKGLESDPPTKWATNLHYFLAHDELKLKNFDNLRLYPALHTALDIYHGVDMLITYTDPNTLKKVIVTVDLTKRRKENCKADIVIAPQGAVTRDKKTCFVPEIAGATLKETTEQDEKRLQKTAALIGNIIKQKLEHGDREYGDLADRIITVVAQIRRKISTVTETAPPLRKTGA